MAPAPTFSSDVFMLVLGALDMAKRTERRKLPKLSNLVANMIACSFYDNYFDTRKNKVPVSYLWGEEDDYNHEFTDSLVSKHKKDDYVVFYFGANFALFPSSITRDATPPSKKELLEASNSAVGYWVGNHSHAVASKCGLTIVVGTEKARCPHFCKNGDVFISIPVGVDLNHPESVHDRLCRFARYFTQSLCKDMSFQLKKRRFQVHAENTPYVMNIFKDAHGKKDKNQVSMVSFASIHLAAETDEGVIRAYKVASEYLKGKKDLREVTQEQNDLADVNINKWPTPKEATQMIQHGKQMRMTKKV